MLLRTLMTVKMTKPQNASFPIPAFPMMPSPTCTVPVEDGAPQPRGLELRVVARATIHSIAPSTVSLNPCLPQIFHPRGLNQLPKACNVKTKL